VSALTDRIRSRGHWDVVIRPGGFVEDRVPYDQLDEIIPSIAVRLRGWPVPYANYDRRELFRGDDWVGQDVDAEMVSHYEAWRFFMSGQFSQLRAVSVDWRRGSEATPTGHGYGSVIEVWEILFYLTEVFELAARLALGPAGDEEMVIAARLEQVHGRGLIVGQSNRAPFMEPYLSQTTSIAREVRISRDQLVADGRVAAVQMARDFFVRFGWKPSQEQLLDHQHELTERGG
jgi:hypothetical protein